MENQDIFGLLRTDIGEEGVAKKLDDERRKLRRKKRRQAEQMRIEDEEEQQRVQQDQQAQQEEHTAAPETEVEKGSAAVAEKPQAQSSAPKQAVPLSKSSASSRTTPASSLKTMEEPPAEVHSRSQVVSTEEPEEEPAQEEPVQPHEAEQGVDQIRESPQGEVEVSRVKDPAQEEARRMLVTALVILGALLILVLGGLFLYTKPLDAITNRTLKISPCASPGCIKAKEISEAMRLSTKIRQGRELHPCDNFYLFSCGGWASSQPVEISVHDVLYNQLVSAMNETLSTTDTEAGENAPYRNLIVFYRSCIEFHTTSMPADVRVRKALYLLDLSFTEWLEHNQDPIFLFFFVVRLSLSKGINTVLKLSVIEKNRDARVVVEVGQSIKNKFYSSGVRAYVERDWKLYISDALFSLGVDAITPKVAKNTFYWDSVLSQTWESAVAALIQEHRVQELTEYQSYVSVEDWMEAINDNLPITLHLKVYSRVDTHDLAMIGDVVSALFEQSKVELVTYIAMQAIAELLRFDFNRRHTHYQASLDFGRRIYSPIETCLRASYDNFYDPMVSLFVREHLTESITKNFKIFFENIREGVNQSVPSFDWMDEATRVKARVKVNAATLKVVESTIREVNTDEEHMSGDFLTNYVRIARYNKERANRYPEPSRKLETSLNLLIGGVTMDQKDVEVSVPATSLLEPALFENVKEKFVNLSAVGSVLASQIVSAGFAPSGSVYAAGGLIMNWWPETVQETYEQRLQCYESEYYRLEKDFVTSSVTKTGTRPPEDVREFLVTYTRGLEIAFALSDIKDNYNAQLFFMRYCQQFCDSNAGNPVLEYKDLNVRLACMFPLVHSQGFRETFACEHTHTLYPKANCERI